MKFFTGIFLCATLFIWQCQGCKDNKCGIGYRSVNDVCQCQPGKYEDLDRCRELAPNEYYGTTTDCGCPDSAFFLVKEKMINPSDGKTVVQIQQRFGYFYKSNIVLDLGFYYYNTPTGDSLAGAFSIPGCALINEVPTHTFTSWAKYISTDSIKLTLINETVNYPYYYDTCVWYLHR